MSGVSSESKTERLVARISRRHKTLLERAAALEGHSLAAFVVVHAVANAQQVINNQKIIRINAEESRRFVEALLAPTRKPTAAARRALKQYRSQVINHL